ncbi:unnamed protein product [Arctogadus glacialis]
MYRDFLPAQCQRALHSLLKLHRSHPPLPPSQVSPSPSSLSGLSSPFLPLRSSPSLFRPLRSLPSPCLPLRSSSAPFLPLRCSSLPFSSPSSSQGLSSPSQSSTAQVSLLFLPLRSPSSSSLSTPGPRLVAALH